MENFFGESFRNMPKIPKWITQDIISYWQENLFALHYLPFKEIKENDSFSSLKEGPSKTFYKKIKEGKLKEKSAFLPGRWLLIDIRKKPEKNVAWIRSDEVFLFEKMKLKPKEKLKKIKKQPHEKEYLKEALKEKGFNSRFCLNIFEIRELYPAVLNFLKIKEEKKVRLPFFIEYNYLVNAFYDNFKKTETWEWFEDKYEEKFYLAGGSKRVDTFGWEPPYFWSTVLGFRPVIEA